MPALRAAGAGCCESTTWTSRGCAPAARRGSNPRPANRPGPALGRRNSLAITAATRVSAATFERLRSTGQLFAATALGKGFARCTPAADPTNDIEPSSASVAAATVGYGAAAPAPRPHHAAVRFGIAGRYARSPPVLSDCIVKRRDGIFAYHLTVVVDDLASGITDVVRGADLLGSMAAQSKHLPALGARIPRYAHTPLLLQPDGSKFAKSRHSLALGEPSQARRELVAALADCSQQDTP